MTETDISKVLIEGEYATIMGVKYKRVEEPKTPVEEAYKDWWGEYPGTENWTSDATRWQGFQAGYNAAYEEKVATAPEEEPVSLYRRFVNEGAYGMTSFENTLKVVNDFLMDEGVIEDESGEYITFTLQKSLLEVPND